MLGLYVHIPFCVKKCKYCDFNSYKMDIDLKKKKIYRRFKNRNGII